MPASTPTESFAFRVGRLLAQDGVKASFRISYSILDKIAFFLNDYFCLAVPSHRTSFRTIWFAKRDPKHGLREEFGARPNWPLRGLYWLSKDLAENREGFVEAMAPDASEIAVIRNHLEHKYLKLHEESWADFVESEDPARGFSMDTLAKSLNRDRFEEKSLRLLKLARAALIYLSLAIHSEERRREQERDPNHFAPRMTTDNWDDDWKR